MILLLCKVLFIFLLENNLNQIETYFFASFYLKMCFEETTYGEETFLLCGAFTLGVEMCVFPFSQMLWAELMLLSKCCKASGFLHPSI